MSELLHGFNVVQSTHVPENTIVMYSEWKEWDGDAQQWVIKRSAAILKDLVDPETNEED